MSGSDVALRTKEPGSQTRVWIHDLVQALLKRLRQHPWFVDRGNVQRRMVLVEILKLSAKDQIMLVSCNGEQFLIGTGPAGVQTIVPAGPLGEAPCN